VLCTIEKLHLNFAFRLVHESFAVQFVAVIRETIFQETDNSPQQVGTLEAIKVKILLQVSQISPS